MYVSLWILLPAAVLLLFLLIRALRGRAGSQDMIAQQRSDTFQATSAHLTVLAQPDVRQALLRGRKIEAIKLVRQRTGLGLKEAKQLVERQTHR